MKNKSNISLKEIFSEAVQQYKKRNIKVAENYCIKILSIEPNHFDSIFMLATLSAIKNDYEKAKQLLHRAIKIQPENPSAYNNLGTAYKELGNLKKATDYYEKALEINSQHTNANYNLGVIFYKLRKLDKAKHYLKKTVTIQNNYALAYFTLANLHTDLKEYDNAVSCFQKAIEINPNLLGAHNNLGLVYRKLNDFKNAVNCYEKAIQIKPNHAGAYHNLALAFKEMGKFEKAIQNHKMAIKYEPENLSHHYYLNDLKKDYLNLNFKNIIEKIMQKPNLQDENAAYGNYLLAKYEKKNKNYKNEISYLIKGHQHFFKSRKEKFDLGIKYCFDDVIQISNTANVNVKKKKDNYEIKPIFIIGVPRSGSTLVEKILASGKKLIPIGEETALLENFFNKKILEIQSVSLGDVEAIRSELNELYKQRGLISKKSDYIFTDKSLNNFFYLNLIRNIYPSAKVINCKRDILSCIMSIFQNNLTELAWTHNLENIFKYFDNYFKIVKKFTRENSDFIYDLQFEKLANEPEKESKKLMQFCELLWDKKCLEFYKRKDLVSKTASNVQIRKAIYKHSLDKYLPYKKLLINYGKKYSWFN